MLQLEYDPQGFVENAGDALKVVSLRVQGDLERIKEFIEKRGHETGGGRSEGFAPILCASALRMREKQDREGRQSQSN